LRRRAVVSSPTSGFADCPATDAVGAESTPRPNGVPPRVMDARVERSRRVESAVARTAGGDDVSREDEHRVRRLDRLAGLDGLSLVRHLDRPVPVDERPAVRHEHPHVVGRVGRVSLTREVCVTRRVSVTRKERARLVAVVRHRLVPDGLPRHQRGRLRGRDAVAAARALGDDEAELVGGDLYPPLMNGIGAESIPRSLAGASIADPDPGVWLTLLANCSMTVGVPRAGPRGRPPSGS
jgi:hypothetical protein